ncbi:MAG: NAD(P)-binding protein, partial [Blastocatellia bacterium]
MNSRRLKIIVIGAGTGGLCLAQGLKLDNVAIEVFERDHSPTDRLQGYRLSIDSRGGYALRTCLPPALFEQLLENCANPSRGVTFLDHRLNRLLAIDLPRHHPGDLDSELPVSRIALRHILME